MMGKTSTRNNGKAELGVEKGSSKCNQSDDHEEQFEQASSGASSTVPKQCSALRKNDFVMIKQRPCKIVEMSTSKTGKHGHAKVHMVALDIFTSKKYEDICPSTHNMSCPNVTRMEYMCMAIQDGFLSLMDEHGGTRDDLKLPEDNDLRNEIQTRLDKEETFNVVVLSALSEESIIAMKKSEQ